MEYVVILLLAMMVFKHLRYNLDWTADSIDKYPILGFMGFLIVWMFLVFDSFMAVLVYKFISDICL